MVVPWAKNAENESHVSDSESNPGLQCESGAVPLLETVWKKKQKMQVSHRIKTGKIAWQKREITAGITLS